jgi:fructose 1,6-bisphosphatase
MLTLSIIKADTGGFVGHIAVHPDMLEAARVAVGAAVADGLLIDGQVASCGDDISLIMTHPHRADHADIHGFAWRLFQSTTDIARGLGLYGAGQDLLSDAFSGNLRGMARSTPSCPSRSSPASRSSASWPTRPSPAPGTWRCTRCSPTRSTPPAW